MDIVTQGLLGAALAQTGARSSEARKAALVGFCAPLLADADALIQSKQDPLLYLDYHRHFTHSLIFIPIGALLVSLLFWPVLRNRLAFHRIYLFALLGYGTAGILDACTSYGTHLFWPFSNERIAWSIISIFDPLFSLVLLVAIAATAKSTNTVYARVGIVLSVVYLSIGIFQQERATAVIQQYARENGHIVERLVVKPTMGNLLLWRSIYRAEGQYYVNAVRVGLSSGGRVFKGQTVQAFDISRDFPNLDVHSTLYKDIQRFGHFSDGFVARDSSQPNMLIDVRYSMLPTSIRPLWGIGFDPGAPESHVSFHTYRSMSTNDRKSFMAMLFD